MKRDGELREYEGDVVYEVWCAGGNVDEIDSDRVADHYYNHDPYYEAARREIQRQRPEPSDGR